MPRHSLWSLLRSFLTLKLIQLAIIYFAPSRFDTSSQLIIDELASSPSTASPYNGIVTSILNKLITWDSVYFNDLFVNEIAYEHQFVFCPGWIKLISLLPSDNYYQLQMWSILIANACHFASALVLYCLSKLTFDSRTSYIASLMMIISPAGVFLTTNYSENLSNLTTLLALYLYYRAIEFNNVATRSNKSVKNVYMYLLSGIVCAFGFTVRANSLLLGVLYLLDLYDFSIIEQDWTSSISSIITGSVLGATLVGQNIHHYLTFCPQRQGWCLNRFPSLFSYAQSHYWSNGFLSYWSLNNVPNFILVAPVLIWNCYSVSSTWKVLPQYRKLLPLVVLNASIIIGGVFFWNVQILNRITSFSPLIYWTLAWSYDEPWFKYVLGYILVWNFVQTALFAAFLPPA
ncbi:GPI18 [Candida theae]|uniref:GPI mannosyltransferase 2 n=1 Tax=Candida theae TaxID=1198502 RepID=A0AAD5BC59_9ASCO|nr:GPI18 [Candida theae]KAI5954711.1 GPI18 [Candida theae]